MSGDELRVEPTALRRHAKGFSEGGERLSQIFAELSAALTAAGRCWGGDAVGRQFEQAYEKPRQAAHESFTKLPGALEDIGSRLDEMAKNYETAEDASTVKG
jgi:WXG100 family type VII secretion target